MKRSFIVTIDGPAGAGKSTVAKALAQRLFCLYLDTGALYRALALKVLREGMPVTYEAAIEELCGRTQIKLIHEGGGMRVLLDEEDVTEEIRRNPISIAASTISAQPAVRKALLSIQRAAATRGCLVAEGRDMGTVVFPDAQVKFFLDASPQERALRRFRELGPRGDMVDLGSVEKDLERRDLQDRERAVAPLQIADDARVIDCSSLTAEEVVEEMLREIAKKRIPFPGGRAGRGLPNSDPGKSV